MARFVNRMNISIIGFRKSVRCWCPIGKSFCTYEIDASMSPDATIPDYMEVEGYVNNSINGKDLTMEDAAAMVRDYLVNEYRPKRVSVSLTCNDAVHMPATVVAEFYKGDNGR